MEERNNPQDKGIEELLDAFEIEIQDKAEETKSEVEKVKYYGNFNINGIEFRNIFIMTEKDESGKTIQHVYSGNTSNEILTVDENGNVEIKSAELQSYLGKVDFGKTIKENDNRLKAISEKGTPEEIKKALNGEDNSEQDTESEAVEADLQEQGEDLEISSYKKINDTHIGEKMPEVFGQGEEHGLAYSNKLNSFVITSKVNGKYQVNDKVEPAKVTFRTIMSIDEKGERVEKKVPHALMKTAEADKEIAVTIEQYGIPDIETVEVLPGKEIEQQRLARQVSVGGEGTVSGEEEPEVRENLDNGGIENKCDTANTSNELNKYGVEQIGDIDGDEKDSNVSDYYDVDIEAIMEEEAQKARVSVKSFKEYVRNADGKTLEEKIDNAHEVIEQEYIGGKRPRE